MARNLRLQYEGAMLHVISRGNRGEPIFPEGKHKGYFVKMLREGSQRYEVEFYAFCVMGTHYHLLVQINKVNLPEFMHFVGSSYANYLVRNGWIGHVFSGRYKSLLVDKEEYLLTVSRYIHLNPVRALLVSKPEEYAWSSYPLFLRSEHSKAADWLNREWLPEHFGQGREDPIQGYAEFVEAGLKDPSHYPHEDVIANSILGSREFLAKVQSRVKPGSREEKSLRELEKAALKCLALDELYAQVCSHFRLGGLAGGKGRRNGEFVRARNTFIFMAKEYTQSTGADIASILREVTPNAISHRYTRIKAQIEEDDNARRRVYEDVEGILALLGSTLEKDKRGDGTSGVNPRKGQTG